ncbi:MAG: ATP-grasp domain-containing protein [Bacteroidales bacterium]|nr:ATP-grasp domain-containing protein [Bacteroidales bacterium]
MKRIAIIGAASGQLPICLKAKEMGIETHCFATENNAICKDYVDYFYPISILEMDRIVNICKEINIDGVVSNASDITAEVVAFVAEKLNLIGIPYKQYIALHDKFYVRSLTESIDELSSPKYYKYEGVDLNIYPCVIKPCSGSAKKGVSFVSCQENFSNAINYAKDGNNGDILIEEFIEGKEISVECLSYKGKHYIIQTTDKDSSSAPHFVELGHHQPAQISDKIKEKLDKIVPKLLSSIGYLNGASHIELKYTEDKIYLIEANLRGGGDDISNKLVQMSSGIDYLKCMIEVAIDDFKGINKINNSSFVGIYYLCKQTEKLLPYFLKIEKAKWLHSKEIFSLDLKESNSNYERNGYLIYKSDNKIIL